jgi:signal peptidase I
MEQTNSTTKWKAELVDWLKSFVLIGGLTAFIYVFVMAPYVVQGRSMESTLHDRERVIVNKAVYYLKDPQQGDIVIIHPDASGDNWIKRVVAVAGDTVEAKDDQLYVNGKPLAEEYLTNNKLKASAAGDIRVIGPVKLDHVVGRAEVFYWPLSEIRLPK